MSGYMQRLGYKYWIKKAPKHLLKCPDKTQSRIQLTSSQKEKEKEKAQLVRQRINLW